jgi:hypothetical protein
MARNITDESIELARVALSTPSEDIARTSGFTQPAGATQGLVAYNLEIPAKHLIPVITPLRNKIKRVVSGFGTQANWQVITGINTTNQSIGVKEAQRGGALTYATARYFASYVECGLESFVTFKADLASKNFMDLKSEATLQLLWSLMIGEELLDLGGNGVSALGVTPTPVLSDSSIGGAINQTTTVKVAAVALTPAGLAQFSGINNGTTGQVFSLKPLVQSSVRTNVDGTSDSVNAGSAQPSAIATIVTATDAAATHAISASVTPVDGAVAYAWYVGDTSAAGMFLSAVTTTSVLTITSAVFATANQPFSALAATDNSADDMVYDGILTQVNKSTSGAYVKSLNAKLTSDGAGGIAELNDAFREMYDKSRLGPDMIFMSSQQLIDIQALVVANGGAPLIRYNSDALSGKIGIMAGATVGSIVNPFTQTYVQLQVHPNMPAGTMLLWSDNVPYPLNDVGSLVEKELRRDYYSMEWPLRTRKYEYGTYFDGVLKCYFPPAFAVINCIAAGH